MAKSRPKLDYNSLGSEGNSNAGILRSAPLTGIPSSLDADLVFAFCLLALCHAMPRPCIGARPVGTSYCYANYGVQLSTARISASQARSRMHYREGMHLLIKGSLLVSPKSDRIMLLHEGAYTFFPCCSELYRYVEPTAHPPP